MKFHRNFLKTAAALPLLALSSVLLSGCPGGGAAREAGERVATGIVREGAERVTGGIVREGQENLTREGAEQVSRVAVSAVEVNTSVKEAAETAASRKLREIKDRVDREAQFQEATVEILCDSRNFEAVSSEIYDAAYSAAYGQGLKFSSEGFPVSEGQIKELAIEASNELISRYCKDLLNPEK